MLYTEQVSESPKQTVSHLRLPGQAKPLVSLVLPAFNEAAIVSRNLQRVCDYMAGLEDKYRWEIVFINDGSTDETGALAEKFAAANPRVKVLHHFTNFGLGQAFRYAFSNCGGDYIVTLDADLSYAPEHIDALLTKIIETRAKIVVASPYMEGGQISNVPWLRKTLSISANKFLSAAAQGQLSTLTSMVRAYDRRFLRTLNLRAAGMDIMPEILHKAMMLGAKIEEIPAHLNWGNIQEKGPDNKKLRRRSSMRIVRHTIATLISGFLFRPVVFFVLPGILLMMFAAWISIWAGIHFSDYYADLTQYSSILPRASAALEMAFDNHTHTFVIGLLAAMLSVQLLSLGILSLQNKSYFEELFHLGTKIRQSSTDSYLRD